MLKLALASIGKRKAQFALIALTVAAGVGLYSGSLILIDSLKAEIQRLAEEGGGDATDQPWSARATDYVIFDDDEREEDEAAAETKTPLDESILADLEAAGLEIETAVGLIEAAENMLVLQGDRVLAGFGMNSFVSPVEEDDFNDLLIVEGRRPTEAGQIALSNELASYYYVELGETVTLKHELPGEADETRSREFTIVGFAVERRREDNREHAGAGYASIVPAEDLRYLLDYEPEQFSRFHLRANWTSEQGYPGEDLPEGLNLWGNETYYFTGTGAPTLLSDTADFVEGLEGLTRITALITALMIFNVFNVILQRRTDELALLRALAFSRFKVFRLLMAEGLVLSLAATAGGLALGLGLGFLLTRFGGLFVESAPEIIGFAWSWQALAGPAALGIAITLAAALLPAWRVSRLRPAVVLAGRHRQFKSFKWRLILGLILLGLGSVLVISFIVEYWTNLSSEIQAVLLQLGRFTYGGLLTIAGIFVLMPIILHHLLRGISRLLQPLATSGFSLILGNLGSRLRHSSININILIIIIALMVGSLVTIQSLRASLYQNLSDPFVSDWVLPGGYEKEVGTPFIPEEAIEELTASGAIKNLSRFQSLDMIKPETEPLEPLEDEAEEEELLLRGLDAASYRGFSRVSWEQGLDLDKDDLATLAGGKMLVREETARRYGWHQGQEVGLSFEDGSSSDYVIGGFIGEEKTVWSYYDIFLDNRFHARQFDAWPTSLIFFDTADGYDHQDVAEVLEDLQLRYRRAFSGVALSPVFWEEARQGVDSDLQQQISSLGNYFILPFAVALFGIACTLSLAVSERRREIGILRALGFKRGQILAGVCLESAGIFLIGLLIGAPLGALFAWMFQLLLESVFGVALFKAAFAPPWLWLGIYGAAGLVLTGLAGLWPAVRASRLNIVQALNDQS